jgi:DNA-binding MltR family transcriptional regulator
VKGGDYILWIFADIPRLMELWTQLARSGWELLKSDEFTLAAFSVCLG